MYKICQSAQSAKRQRELEKGLLQLLLRRSYEDISVSEICQHMCIPRKSFYRYFSSKDGALYALIDHTLAQFFEMPTPQHKTRGTAVGDLDLFFVFWHNNQDFLEALLRNSLGGILVERATSFALREGLLPQKFKSNSQAVQEMSLTFAVSGLLSMTIHWHLGGYPLSPSEMTRLAVNMLTTPLLNP